MWIHERPKLILMARKARADIDRHVTIILGHHYCMESNIKMLVVRIYGKPNQDTGGTDEKESMESQSKILMVKKLWRAVTEAH